MTKHCNSHTQRLLHQIILAEYERACVRKCDRTRACGISGAKGVRSLLELCVRSACVWGYLCMCVRCAIALDFLNRINRNENKDCPKFLLKEKKNAQFWIFYISEKLRTISLFKFVGEKIIIFSIFFSHFVT